MAFLEETRIIGNSTPFIQITFNVFSIGHPLGVAKGSGANEAGYYIEGSPSTLILNKRQILDAEFSGPAVGARKGKITVVDPQGIWTQAMNYIGAWKNDGNNVGKSNMTIEYGWVGLAPNSSGEKSLTKQIPALLLKTGFSMSDQGTATIILEFIENAENMLNLIKFNKLEDMRFVNSAVDANKAALKNKKVHELMEYITYKSSSVLEQLIKYGVRLEFEPTYDDSGDGYGENGKEIFIKLGDTLGSKLNELIASAMPNSSWSTNNTYSYEIFKATWNTPQGKGSPVGHGTSKKWDNGYQYLIKFKWKKAAKSSTEEDTPATQSAGVGWVNGEKGTSNGGTTSISKVRGPTLLWKKQSMSAGQKSLISFDIDLKMLDYAASMIRSELDAKLTSMKEEDWTNLYEVIGKLDATSANASMLSMTAEQLAQSMKTKGGSAGLPSVKGRWFESSADTEKREAMNNSVEQFNKILREASSNSENQISTIIANNAFKARAKIMGDPTLGTDNTMWMTEFMADFSSVTQFASFFNRLWTMTNVVHKIEEGGFFSEIELMAIPPRAAVVMTGGTGAGSAGGRTAGLTEI